MFRFLRLTESGNLEVLLVDEVGRVSGEGGWLRDSCMSAARDQAGFS